MLVKWMQRRKKQEKKQTKGALRKLHLRGAKKLKKGIRTTNLLGRLLKKENN
jgi:hypothetical protein